VTADQIITEVQKYHPSIKDCAWSVHKGLGYFRCDHNGKRRAIPVETHHWWHGMGVPMQGQERSLMEVVSEIVVGLEQ